MRSSVKSVLGTVLLVLTIAFPLESVLAQVGEPSTPASEGAAVQISLRPHDLPDGSRFDATVEPGESVEMIAVLQNFGAEPIEVRTYTANLLPMVNGGLALASHEEEKTGSTSWMNYETSEMTLQSQELVEYPFTISVPDDTPPGQYVNAIALETMNPIEDGSMFKQYFRKVVSVYIVVPGEAESDFALGDPQLQMVPDMSAVHLPVTNTGDQRVDIEGSVQVLDAEGNVVFEGSVKMGPVYNGQETIMELVLGALSAEGEYFLSYDLTDSISGVSHSADSVAMESIVHGTSDEALISFENVLIEPNADPIVFANVSVDINLAQSTYPSSRLTLSVYHNDEHVEDFVLAENLALPQGTTTVSQRYLPGTNWESGTYTFSLKLESTDAGASSVLLEEGDVATLEVP